jgi:hypothetical protein
MNWGMITCLERYPDTYNGRPLVYAALASQKKYMAVYLTAIYSSAQARRDFEEAYHRTGKRLDAGKSCVRFRKLDDLPLELLGDVIASMGVDEYVALAASARPSRTRARGARRKSPKKRAK